MDIGRPATTTEVRDTIEMVQYYRAMSFRMSHILSLLTQVAIVPKGRKILWNEDLDSYFK